MAHLWFQLLLQKSDSYNKLLQKLAKKIVDSAIEAGAEIIKHQTHIPEDEMSIIKSPRS